MVQQIIEYISIFLALMAVLSIHEFAHAFVAVKSGDNTPRLYDRYTINPFAHFDLFGLISFAIIRVGWAKPMPVNPNNFKHFKLGCFLVSIAGIVSNYLLAFIVYPLILLAIIYVPTFGKFTEVLILTLRFIYGLSLNFAVFNLLPIYPLDGFRVVDVFVKKRSKAYYAFKKYGVYVFFAFILLGIIADVTNIYQLDVLSNAITEVSNFIGTPIRLFWGLIFNG